MPSILEEFAYGNVSPEAMTVTRNSKYGRAMKLVARLEQKLLERLGAEDEDLFQKYVMAQGEVNQLTAVENFAYGYKLALVMTAESFLGMDELYVSGEDE